jgi:hypothetical protein
MRAFLRIPSATNDQGMSTSGSFLLFAGLMVFTAAFVLIAKRAQRSPNRTVRMLFGGSAATKRNVGENLYPEMRRQALDATGSMIGTLAELPADHVFGVIMEWPVSGGVLTAVGFENGDSSLYISTGQIMIGGQAKILIRDATLAFVNVGREVIGRVARTDDVDPVRPDHMAFYLLTPAGRHRAIIGMEDLQSGNDPLSRLHDAGQALITQWRLAEAQDAFTAR